MDEDVVPGEIYNGQTYVVRYLWRVKLNSDMVFVYLCHWILVMAERSAS